MTLDKDNNQDPGWWRRGMTKRGQIIIVVISGLVIVGVFVAMALTGTPLF